MLPDVPTIAETVPGYEARTWAGLGVPKGTPTEIIARLNHEINAGLANPTIKSRLAEIGTIPMIFTATEFGAYIAAEIGEMGQGGEGRWHQAGVIRQFNTSRFANADRSIKRLGRFCQVQTWSARASIGRSEWGRLISGARTSEGHASRKLRMRSIARADQQGPCRSQPPADGPFYPILVLLIILACV